jgi:hypothetical protein
MKITGKKKSSSVISSLSHEIHVHMHIQKKRIGKRKRKALGFLEEK